MSGVSVAYVISSMIVTGVKEGPEKAGELFITMIGVIFLRILIYFRCYKKQKRVLLGFLIAGEAFTTFSLLIVGNDHGVSFFITSVFMMGLLISVITSIQLFKLNGRTATQAQAAELIDQYKKA